jgi:FHA domain-containing protein
MNLVIRAQTLNSQAVVPTVVGVFGAQGGTIGRADTNTLALPDPERLISRLQAEVSVEQGQFLIRNAGGNPIGLNGRMLNLGDTGVLNHGDEVSIGGYLLNVTLDEPLADASCTVMPLKSIAGPPQDDLTPSGGLLQSSRFGGTVKSIAGPPQDDVPPSGGLLQSSRFGGAANPAVTFDTSPTAPLVLSPNNPFADLLGSPEPAAAPCVPGVTRLPDDFDPFAVLNTPTPSAKRPNADSLANNLLGSVNVNPGRSSSLDALFGLNSSTSNEVDESLARLGSAKVNSVPRQSTSTDPLERFGAARTPNPARQDNKPAAFNHISERHAAYEPPAVVTQAHVMHISPAPPPEQVEVTQPGALQQQPVSDVPLRVDSPQPVAPVTSAPSADAHLLWAAFCEGAQTNITLPDGLNETQMRMLGVLMRESVEGVLRLMAVRATTKNELRAEVTTIRPRNNNPLKFSPNAEAALNQLLQPTLRGFLSGPAAMQSAMYDLLGHSIGTMAGMRAALGGVFSHFEPNRLEAKLSQKSMLDSLIPGARKAKLWDLYLQHFQTTSTEAEEDFHVLFGNAFLAAYEEQLDKLHEAQPSAST